MELQQNLTTENYQLLIPTVLSNIRKINFNNLDNLSIYAALSSLPAPPASEIQYLLYSDNAKYCLAQFIINNAPNIASLAHYKYGIGGWVTDAIAGHTMSFYVLEEQKKDAGFIENYYQNSNNAFLLFYLVRNSIYTSLKCLENLAAKDSYELQKVAVATCSLETVRTLTKSRYEKVRVEAYKRLGPMECLDEMLIDNSRHVRSLAAEWMPIGYTVPQKALSDRAYWSFSKILEKVSLDQIPMLLGNKNLAKNKWLMQKLQSRLDSKF